MVVWVLVVGSSRNTTEAGGCWWGGVGGLLFVNYIVDASIFDAACIWSHDDHGRGVFGFLVVVVWWVCVVCSLMIVLCCVA